MAHRNELDLGNLPPDATTESMNGSRETRSSVKGSPEFEGLEILQELGAGGFGRVYEARQTSVENRRVAVKVLKPASNERTRRFRDEVGSLAALSHPNIAQVYDSIVSTNGDLGIVMEFVAGESLDKAQIPNDYAKRLAIALQHCDAASEVHRQGYYHCDIKPLNIVIDVRDGEFFLKLIDFGLAIRAGRSLFGDCNWAGTPEYMSPEQMRHCESDSGIIDARSDVYSIGCTIFEILSGRQLFPRRPNEEHHEYFHRKFLGEGLFQSSSEADLLRAIGPTRVVNDLASIIRHATYKDPAQRYSSVSTLSHDLRAVLSRRPISLKSNNIRYRLSLLLERRWRTVCVLVFLLMLAACAIAALSRLWGENEQLQKESDRLAGENVEIFEEKKRAVEDVGRLMDETILSGNPMEVMAEAKASPTDGLAKKFSETAKDLESGSEPQMLKTRLTAINTLATYGRLNEAIAELEDLIRALVEEFGSENDDTFTAQCHLARFYVTLGRYQDAIKIYRSALEIWENRYGRQDERCLALLHYMSFLDLREGRAALALEKCDQLIELVPTSEKTTVLRNEIKIVRGRALSDLQRYEEAIQTLDSALSHLLSKGWDIAHLKCLNLRNEIAYVKLCAGDIEPAILEMREILTHFREQFTEDRPPVLEARYRLAMALLRSNTPSEVEEGVGELRLLASCAHERTEKMANESLQLWESKRSTVPE
ncbi:MAG: protein kinase [Planctomycetota bacterium]